MMRKRLLDDRTRVAMPILIFLPIYLIWFKFIELVPFRFCIRTDLLLDKSIPFIKQFAIPYFLWFLFIPLVGAYLVFYDKEEYKRFQALLISGMVFFLILNTFFPTGLILRPAYVAGRDIFATMVRFLYSIDTSTNVFPSIHVYTSVVAYVCMFRSTGTLACKRSCRIMVALISVSIILATMFLKQHSVLDVFFGIAMCPILDHVVRKGEVKDVALYGNRW
ncbi:MAG: phosphatase PAP2 family protein [Lachnospiraceae bacterium]|nr:phosphatase PAP2 family protein [Lachnospiraceae bacterium]